MIDRTPFLGKIAFAGALVYIASIPLEDLVRVAFVGSLARGTGLLLVGTAFFALLGGALRIRRTDSSILLLGAFVAWAVVSYFWSGDKDLTLGRIQTFIQLFLATLILWQLVSTEARLRVALQAFVVGCFTGSLYSIAFRSSTDETGIERYSVGGPNSFGVQVVFAMLGAYWLMSETTSRNWRRFYAAFLVVGTIAVFATASRTALLALGVAIVFAVADRRLLRPRNAAVSLALAGASVYAVNQFVSSRQLERISTLSEAATSGGNGRSTVWGLALDVFTAHPVEGLGAAVFRDYSEAAIGISRVAHNSFLGVAADLGSVGLLLFVAMCVAAGRGLWQLPPNKRKMWIGLAAVWLVGANTLTWENQKFTYFVLVLFAAQSTWATARVPESPRRMAEAHQG